MNAVANRSERKERNVHQVEQQVWFSPEVNIFETPEGYLLEGEMPGVTRDGLEITQIGRASCRERV